MFECQDSIGTEAPVNFISPRSSTERKLKLIQTTIQLEEKIPATEKYSHVEDEEEPTMRAVWGFGLQCEPVRSYRSWRLNRPGKVFHNSFLLYLPEHRDML